MGELEVSLAGAVALRRGHRQVRGRDLPGRQLQLVTALLVLERHAPVPVDTIADVLWADTLPSRWRVAIRNLVSKVRRALVDLGLDGDALVGGAGVYRVDLGPVTVDLEDASTAAEQAGLDFEAGNLEEARRGANHARAVLSRPILAGVRSTWLDDVRVRAATRHVDALVVLGACRSEQAQPTQARSVLVEALDLEPLREDAWRALMRTELFAGNTTRALEAYETCRDHLAEQLGVDPSPATQQLHLDILQSIPRPMASATMESAVAIADGVEQVSATRAAATLDGPPYVGLRAFHRDEAGLFFGRDTEVQELVELLTRHGTAAVVGASGAGKSSLVRAGLLPAIDRGAIPDSDTWIQVVVAPGSTPIKSLATELATVSDAVASDWITGRLAEDEDGLHQVADAVLADQGPGARLLLVVDQFEELFVLGDPEEAELVVALLRAATRRLDGNVVVVVTLRADLYDRALDVPGMADWLSRMQFVVPPMTGEQIEEVVTGPAVQAGATLEEGLLARIIADGSGEPGTLPLLQHLLYELWDRRTDRVMTRGAYHDLGGVAGALANRAEAVYEDLDHDQRSIARRVLLRSVQPGEDGADSRRPVRASEWSGPTDQRQPVEAVVDRLVGARLLTASQDTVSGERVVELAHEALIDGWPRLRSWVDEARGWLLDHRRVTVAADDWARHDRHDDWLLAGLPLDEAHELLLADSRGDVDLHLSPREHELVTVSLALREQDRAREASRVADQRRIERRSVRRLQALVAMVALVAVVAGVQWLNGRTATRIAEARQFSVASERARGDDPQLALLLALEARDRLGSVGGDARDDVASALHAAIAGNRLVTERPDLGTVLGMASDGSVVLVAAPEDSETEDSLVVEVHDMDTGTVVATLDGHEDAPLLADATGEGIAVVATETGMVHVWDWREGRGVGLLGEQSDDAEPAHLEISPDGKFVALSGAVEGSDSPVLVWDRSSDGDPLELGQGTNNAGTMPLVRFHPDGTRILVVRPLEGTVQVRAVGGGWDEVDEPIEHPGVFDAAWSPDGRWLALAGEGVAVLDGGTGDEVVDVRGAPDIRAAQLAWSPDSTRIVLGPGGDMERLHAWTVVEDGEPVGIAGPLTPEAPPLACPTVLFGSDPGVVLEASRCGDGLRGWDLRPGAVAEIAHLPSDQLQTSGLAFSHDGTTLAATRTGGALALWSTVTWESERTLEAHAEDTERVDPGLFDMRWSAGDDVLVTRGAGDAAVWDTATWEQERLVGIGPGAVAIGPDARHVAYSGRDRTIQESPDGGLVWVLDTETDHERTLRWPDAPTVRGAFPVPYLLDADFSPDGHLLAATTGVHEFTPDPVDGIAIWDWRDERLVALAELPATPGRLDWDSTGTRLAVGTHDPDNTVQVWHVPEPDDSPDVASLDGPTVVMTGHQGWVQQAVFSPDDAQIATCSGDGTVRLWDPAAGREAQRVVDDGILGFCSVAFSPDGTRLAVSDVTRGVLVFSLDVDELAEIARDRLIRTWTPDECQDHLELATCPA